MKAQKLYTKLDNDFITDMMSDEWFDHMGDVADFLSDNFKERSMGLLCDNSEEITHIYSAVFPSKDVMQYILDQCVENALLFTHHPSIWDIRKAPEIFYQMDRDLLKQFQQKNISIYNLHVPLDAYGEYSTSMSFAHALDLEVVKPFAQYHGILCGVIGKTNLTTAQKLQNKFAQVVGHDVKLYQYGDDEIKDGLVAVVAGGGNDMDVLQEVKKEGVNILITGVTVKNQFTREVHDFEKDNKINVIGGTHYSTEKFACEAICDYFTKLDLSTEFISEKPILEDM